MTPTHSTTLSADLNDAARTFRDPETGLTVTVPPGFVMAATPPEAASRFPAALGDTDEALERIFTAQDRLSADTVMVAFGHTIDGVTDNVGIKRVVGAGPALSDLDAVQLNELVGRTLAAVHGSGARDITATQTTLAGRPAERFAYTIPAPGGHTCFGVQHHLACGSYVLVLTVTAGTPERAKAITACVDVKHATR